MFDPAAPRYLAAACQTDFPCPADRGEIASRVDRMLQIVEQAVAGYSPLGCVKLFAFPEFAHAAPIYEDVKTLARRLALPVPNEHTERYRSKAAELDVYIQTGTFLEVDDRWPERVFNTTCLIGPKGMLTKYRKVHPWTPLELHTSPADLPGYAEPLFPVADTCLGKIGAAICYDWLFPEAIRQIAANGAEIIVRLSAYMDPWGATPPMDWWTLINRTRALENTAYVVAANQAAAMRNFPPFSWPGGSMVVDYDGRVLAQADPGPGEAVVVAPIDLPALRHARQTRRCHGMLNELRRGAYTVYKEGD